MSRSAVRMGRILITNPPQSEKKNNSCPMLSEQATFQRFLL